MKKLISLFLAICMILPVFTACSDSESDEDSSTKKTAKSGWLLPTNISDSKGEFDIDLNWSENGCTFEADGATFTFTYDESKRSLSISIVDGDNTTVFENISVFDAQDRFISMDFGGHTVMEISYKDGKMVCTAFGEDEAYTPTEIVPDWEERSIPMPPFNDPDQFVYFTQWGDLCAGASSALYEYEYDKNGNAQTISVPGLGDYSWTISYGDAPMTASWQRAVLKFMMTLSLGQAFVAFAADMLCFAAYQHHNEK